MLLCCCCCCCWRRRWRCGRFSRSGHPGGEGRPSASPTPGHAVWWVLCGRSTRTRGSVVVPWPASPKAPPSVCPTAVACDRAIQYSDCDGLSQGQSHFEAGGGKRTKSFVGQSVSWQARDRLLGFEEGLFQSFARGEWGSTWLRTAGCSTQHRAPRHLARVQVAGHARDRPRCPERSCAPTLKVRYHLCTYYTYVYTAYRLSLIVAHCCFAPVWPHLRKVDWNKAEPSQRRRAWQQRVVSTCCVPKQRICHQALPIMP